MLLSITAAAAAEDEGCRKGGLLFSQEEEFGKLVRQPSCGGALVMDFRGLCPERPHWKEE